LALFGGSCLLATRLGGETLKIALLLIFRKSSGMAEHATAVEG
jgi:hypothetical protein